jgi:hypothetical protein
MTSLPQFTAQTLEQVREKVRAARMSRIEPHDEDILRAILLLVDLVEKLSAAIVALEET